MINILIWLAAFFCPNPNHSVENHGNCNLIHVNVTTTTSTPPPIDTGGETGGIPIPPPPPPPPPKGN